MDQCRKVIEYFNTVIRKNALGKAYLFIGEEDSLIFDIVLNIACRDSLPCQKCWDCLQVKKRSHPDLFIIAPRGLTIGIDDVRQGVKFLSMKAFSLPKKILLVLQSRQLTPPAASAFLKTLEEPPPDSFIGLSANGLEGMLDTVMSRCCKIFLPAGSNNEQAPKSSYVEDFLLGRNVVFKDREKFALFMGSFIDVTRRHLMARVGCANSGLPSDGEHEKILNRYPSGHIIMMLEESLRVYLRSNFINMNLALRYLRSKLGS